MGLPQSADPDYIAGMVRRPFLRALLISPLLAAPAIAQPRRQQAPAQAPLPPAEDIARAEAWLNELRSLRARFLQVDQRGLVAEGTVWMQRPGRMRFEYDPPSQVLIVADGTTVTFQDRQLGQTSSVFLGQTPLSMMLAERVRLSGDVTVTGGERFANRLEIAVVRTSSPRDGTLILGFATQPFGLVQWRVIDAQAQEVRVSLSRIERDVALEARLFRAPQAQPGQPGGG